MLNDPDSGDQGLRPWELLLALLALAVLVAVNLQWLQVDQAPPFEHSGRSIRDGVLLWRALGEGWGFRPDMYPPLAYLVSSACYALCGVSESAAILSQYLFLVPYLLGCWWIGREMGGRGGGALTLLAAAGSPWMSVHLHGYFLEVGTTAMVAVAFACFLASRGCRRPWPTLGLGLTLGLGMLSKWSFLLFLAPALAWAWFRAWTEGSTSRWLAGGVVVAALVTVLAWLGASGEAGGLSWKGLLMIAMDAWLLLGLVAWRFRRGRAGDSPPTPWLPGAGLTLAVGLAACLSLWWYFLSVGELRFKVAQDFGQGFSYGVSAELLLGTLAAGFWAAPWLLALGAGAGLALRPLRLPTSLALVGLVLPLAFYLLSRVPPGPRYLLPATVFLYAVAFAWWGRLRQAARVLVVPVAAVAFLQVGSWLLPLQAGTLVDQVRSSWMGWWRIPTVPGPDSVRFPVGEALDRVLAELDRTGEYRISAVILPGGRFDVDALLLGAILRGRVLDVEHLLPGRLPETSMVLVSAAPGVPLSTARASRDWLRDHVPMESYEAPGWGLWVLFGHPTRRDGRPPPRSGAEPVPPPLPGTAPPAPINRLWRGPVGNPICSSLGTGDPRK